LVEEYDGVFDLVEEASLVILNTSEIIEWISFSSVIGEAAAAGFTDCAFFSGITFSCCGTYFGGSGLF
jgi:hypothetical protein